MKKFQVKWGTEKDNRDSHYWCHGCGGLFKEVFLIRQIREVHGALMFCRECMQALQAAIVPLSVLVQTGENTNCGGIDESV